MRFLGTRDALPQFLATADVYALASTEESFGLSALEAMACGTPVVATAVGGVSEVVEDGRTGLLAAVDDIDGYAERLGRLLSDTGLAADMGREARAQAEERFERRAVVARYEAVYRGLLER